MLPPAATMLLFALATGSCAGLASNQAATTVEVPVSKSSRPVTVIAHRGASALRPEHTIAAYIKAIEDGADAIEPDLVSTRDGVLVARHENEIGGTTDVAEHAEFASRRATKSIDGRQVDGWFTEDFTLQELRTLRARERLPELRSSAYDGRFPIATFDEIIGVVALESKKHGRVIGLVPEIKHPSYFSDLGLAMEDKLLALLAAHDYTRRAPVIIQSFETANLRLLRDRIGHGHANIRLLQLLGSPTDRPYNLAASGTATTYADLMTRDGLHEIAGYADAIGPSKDSLDLRNTDDGRMHSALVDAAHASGLEVIAYTFRPENHFLPHSKNTQADPGKRNEPASIAEMRRFIDAGIDGLFVDDPAVGRAAVDGR